jgi:para-aminobenzoate synthetase/4-amino-4-deoxychorismate lyase
LIEGSRGEYGVGGGIVWDSTAEAEYEECLAKSEPLLRAEDQWLLVDAIGGHFIQDPAAIDRHLDRLSVSSAKCGVTFDLDRLRAELLTFDPATKEERIKIRTSVYRDGSLIIVQGWGTTRGDTLAAVVAKRPVASGDPNLQIKTTSRAVLEEHLDENPDVDEVLLFNEAGLITEFCRGNVVVRRDGQMFTPRPESGCLPGISVLTMIAQGEASYADLPLASLSHADEIYFVNSVAGMIPVRLVDAQL